MTGTPPSVAHDVLDASGTASHVAARSTGIRLLSAADIWSSGVEAATLTSVQKPDATVEQRMIKAGERVGNLWIIESGLKPGEKVIVEGLQKVKPGVQVSAKTVKLEETSLAPNAPPAESKAKAGGK